MRPEWPEKINKLLIHGSILDLCSGGGRFYGVFKGRDYTGVDKDVAAITNAKKTFPRGNWIVGDVAKWQPDKAYDNIFTWVALQHILPKDIVKVFKMMKETSGNIIMCERIYDPEPNESDYLWTHDYKKHFKGLKMIESISNEVWLMNWRKK